MAELFNLQNESDLSGWTSTVTSGGSIVQSGGSALGGSSGGIELQRPSGGTSSQYLVKTFTALTSQTVFRYRFYLDRNTLAMTNADAHDIWQVYSASDASARARLTLLYSNTPKFRLRTSLRNDAGSETNSSILEIGDTWSFDRIEIRVAKASNGTGANNGTLTVYLDGSESATLGVSGVDIFDLFDFDETRLGHVAGLESGVTGTMYLDEVVARDDDTTIGAVVVDSAPVNTLPASGTCINTYEETAVPGISVAAGSSDISSVATTCTAGCTLTYDTTGTSVTISGNGTNAATLSNGASEAEWTTVLDTLTMRGSTPDTTITVTVIPTDGTLNDSDQFTVLCDPASITITGTNNNVVAAVASLQIRLLVGQTNDTISVNVVDDTGGTPLESDSSFIVGTSNYFSGHSGLSIKQLLRRRRKKSGN